MAAPLGFYDPEFEPLGWYDSRAGENILSWFDDALVTGTVASELVTIDGQPLTLVDSWRGTVFSTYSDIRRGASGQSFTGNGGYLRRASFYCSINAASTLRGFCYAELWSHTGTFGSTGTPSTLLAVSEVVEQTTASTGQAWRSFEFKGVNQVQLVNATKYFIVLRAANSTTSVSHSFSGSHAGNAATQSGSSGSAWAADSSRDVLFEVYTCPVEATFTEKSHSVVDTYFTNQSWADFTVDSSNWVGQSFTGNGTYLRHIAVFMKGVGANYPLVCYLYSHTGTYGSTGVPDQLLATSQEVDPAAIGTTAHFFPFSFRSDQQVLLENGTKYFLVVASLSSGSAVVHLPLSQPNSHSGNRATWNGATWTAAADDIAGFEVYGVDQLTDTATPGAPQAFTNATFDFIGTDTVANDLEYEIQIRPDKYFDQPFLIDSYTYESAGSNQSYAATDAFAQVFTWSMDAAYLASAVFKLAKVGSPTTNVTAVLYEITGTYGVASDPLGAKPTGTALVTSDPLDPSTFSTVARKETFTFPTKFYPTPGKYYALSVEFAHNATNRIVINLGSDVATGSVAKLASGAWAPYTKSDLYYEIYGRTFDNDVDRLSVSDAGFVDTTSGDTHPFISGENIRFTVQPADYLGRSLTPYYWRARAYTPSVTSEWGPTRTMQVTLAVNAIRGWFDRLLYPAEWLDRHNRITAWFEDELLDSTFVALTGVTGTGAVGDVTAVISGGPTPITGSGATGAAGNVGVDHEQGLTTVLATGAAGNVGVDHTQALTNVVGTGAAGTTGVDHAQALTNTVGTGAAGNVGVDHEQALTNVVGTGAAGNVGVSIEVPITGVAGAGAAGYVGTAGDQSAAGTGVSATGAAGNVGVEHAQDLTNVAGTGAAGNVGVDHEQAITGVVGTSTAGNVGVDLVIPITGVFGMGAVGDVVGGSDVVVAITGAQGTGTVGNVGAHSEIPLTGVQGTGETGVVSPGADLTLAITGNEATGVAGTLGVDHRQGLTGAPATGAVGSVGKDRDKAITGNTATGAAGSVRAVLTLATTGVAGTADVGSVGVDLVIPLIGVAGLGAAGTVLSGNDASEAATGVEATGSAGTPGVDVTVALTGVGATGRVGTVGAGKDLTLSITGVGATGVVGTLGVTHEQAITGGEATGDVGAMAHDTVVRLLSTIATGLAGRLGVERQWAITGVQATGHVHDLYALIAPELNYTDEELLWAQMQVEQMFFSPTADATELFARREAGEFFVAAESYTLFAVRELVEPVATGESDTLTVVPQ